MAVVVNGNTVKLTSTSIDAGITSINFTVCAWINIISSAESYGTILALFIPDVSYAALEFPASRMTGLRTSYKGTANHGFDTAKALSLNTWYFVAMTCSGTTIGSLKNYIAAVSESSLTSGSSTSALVGTFNPTTFGIGDAVFTNEPPNVRIANVMVYKTPLNENQLISQKSRLLPVDFANLTNWYPMFDVTLANNYNDLSGNKRTLTASGSFSVFDGPPVEYGANF